MGKFKETAERKTSYRSKLENLLDNYNNILIVTADNVGSNQMQKIRIALRGTAVLLMGKNTMMRKVIREKMGQNPKLEKLLPYVYGNIGFVFTNVDLNSVRKTIVDNKVPAAARVGVLAPADCWIPAGPTGMDPGQTSFFQALNIATKIVKGAVEIVTDVHLIPKGTKVTPSHVSLLSKLDIKPFFYSMGVSHVFDDGAVYEANVLDITQEDLFKKFFRGVGIITALSLRVGMPNIATIPHSFARAMKHLLAIAVAVPEITFKEAEPFKEYLADPAAYAAKHGLAAGGGSGGGAGSAAAGSSAPSKGAEAAPAKKEEAEEEEDAGGGFGGLFD